MEDRRLELEEVTRRVNQISQGLGLSKPPETVLYYAPKTTLSRVVKDFPKIIEQESIQLVEIDSLGASGVDPDRVMDVIEAFSDLRALGVTVIATYHQSKLQAGETYDHKTPF